MNKVKIRMFRKIKFFFNKFRAFGAEKSLTCVKIFACKELFLWLSQLIKCGEN